MLLSAQREQRSRPKAKSRGPEKSDGSCFCLFRSAAFQAAGAAQALAAVFRPRRTRQAAVITRSAPGESILLSPFEKSTEESAFLCLCGCPTLSEGWVLLAAAFRPAACSPGRPPSLRGPGVFCAVCFCCHSEESASGRTMRNLLFLFAFNVAPGTSARHPVHRHSCLCSILGCAKTLSSRGRPQAKASCFRRSKKSTEGSAFSCFCGCPTLSEGWVLLAAPSGRQLVAQGARDRREGAGHNKRSRGALGRFAFGSICCQSEESTSWRTTDLLFEKLHCLAIGPDEFSDIRSTATHKL